MSALLGNQKQCSGEHRNEQSQDSAFFAGSGIRRYLCRAGDRERSERKSAPAPYATALDAAFGSNLDLHYRYCIAIGIASGTMKFVRYIDED